MKNLKSLATLLVLISITITAQTADAQLSPAQQLKEWNMEVIAAEKEISSRFDLREARKSQLLVFNARGVCWAKRYTSSWSSWVFTDWSTARRNLHSVTRKSLRNSLSLVYSQGNTNTEWMLERKNMMEDFREKHTKVLGLLEKRLRVNARQGYELDICQEYVKMARIAQQAKAPAAAAVLTKLAKVHEKRANVWKGRGAELSRLICKIGVQDMGSDFDVQYVRAMANSEALLD